jgi:hypothetical protein
MATVPLDQKFHTIAANVATKERGSALVNSQKEIFTMQDVVNTINPYKVYSALMNQDGTSNPTQQVISNTISPSFSISFTRSSAGEYTANLGPTASCPLIIGKTIILCNAQGFFSGGPYIYAVPVFILNTGGLDTYLYCKFYAVDSSGNQTLLDITGDPLYFEIRVYE